MAEPDWSQYEAVVEKNWTYYRPRFERFAKGGWLSWNWAAFFATLTWLAYRRLHTWSWLYFFFSTPFLVFCVSMVAMSGDSCERSLDPQGLGYAGIMILGVVLLGWILPPLVADRIYYDRVRALAAQSARVPATGGIAGTILLQVCVVLAPPVLLSGYANYIYRSMVSEGVSLAAAAKTPLAEYIADNGGRLPARIDEVVSSTSGKYVGRLELQSDGTIKAVFGAGGRKLAGHSVSMMPTKKDGKIVEWTCRSDDLPNRCLPASCRRD